MSVQKGQKEAGLALGLEKEYIFKNIILPQAIRNAIPALGNVWQLTLKDTALISITGLIEILRVAKEGITMIIVTHEMGFAKNVSNKVVFFADGIIAESGTPKDIFENPKHESLTKFLNTVF